ncbi:unnamed protein product [Rotaria socialis]|uniref:ribose-5-phosphate isomerase n=1 Tax=Rotaria socialis TaxID=392032 RepID=A0A818QQG5_9BILA|nr:unnamed protein product [Rotaria socialis]CAF3690374.1 unnamed protein product [Rotaria socialis]CAF3751384.1 unnamed protein product [Rotaria socialis]CAF4315243.1 unnamed protein product [Rotaria socialis]CAF4553045.1 unnamed protein product [Rotaria socialis]
MPVNLAKESAANAAVDEQIHNDIHIIGVGSGSTIVPAVKRIAEIVHKNNLDLICVPTSLQARELILSNGLKLGSLAEYQELDLAIDGADEVDEQFNCIKGGGGCQTQEKLVAVCAKRFIVVADEKKWSPCLGTKWTKGIPIEVIPVAYKLTKKEIEKQLGGEVVVREGTEKLGPVLTDQGNFILDWKFDPLKIVNWFDVNRTLKLVPGVVETGLFVNMIYKGYFGNSDGKVEIRTNPTMSS